MTTLKTFASLPLSDALHRAIRDEGYTTPTPIQQQAIPPAMQGLDILGSAQTGTGKTAAFALPILHRLMTQPRNLQHRGPALPRALILAPTRELATQIGDSFATYGRHTGLRHAVIYGGVSQFHQERALRAGVDILVATPGRLMDLMEQRLMNFSQIGVLVLDEADRMLDMGFIQPIRRIVAALPQPRQTMLFSATMPRSIQDLAHSLLKNPTKVSIAHESHTAALIEQSLIYVPRVKKQALLQHILTEQKIGRAVVFTKTKHGADRVMKKLVAAGITAEAIHGNKAQNQRQRALDAFRIGRSRVLVATDVAARGLDVDAITHVFNFDLPMEPEAYVHRIGRTGRAGATGFAVSFCDPEERGLLRDIERLTGNRLPTKALPETLPQTPHMPMEDNRPAHPRSGGGRPYGGGGSTPGWTASPSTHGTRRAPHSTSNDRNYRAPHAPVTGAGAPRTDHSAGHRPAGAAPTVQIPSHARVPASALAENRSRAASPSHGGHGGHAKPAHGAPARGPRAWSNAPKRGR